MRGRPIWGAFGSSDCTHLYHRKSHYIHLYRYGSTIRDLSLTQDDLIDIPSRSNAVRIVVEFLRLLL